MNNIDYVNSLHNKAVAAAKTFINSQADLIDVLQKLDACQGYRDLDCSSLFVYCIRELKLSEDVSCNLIAITRKAAKIPALKHEIKAGNIKISAARRIASVLTLENQTEWLEKAKTLSQRKLEREIAKANPKLAVPEQVKYVSETRLDLRLGVSEQLLEKLKRAQDILSQNTAKHASFEDTLESALELYLQHKDPVRKAERVLAKKVMTTSPANTQERKDVAKADTLLSTQSNLSVTKADVSSESVGYFNGATKAPPQNSAAQKQKPVPLRQYIPAKIRHAVFLRDKGQCVHRDHTGQRCENKRWIEIHHRKPVTEGGTNLPENLELRCSAHHDVVHGK